MNTMYECLNFFYRFVRGKIRSIPYIKRTYLFLSFVGTKLSKVPSA